MLFIYNKTNLNMARVNITEGRLKSIISEAISEVLGGNNDDMIMFMLRNNADGSFGFKVPYSEFVAAAESGRDYEYLWKKCEERNNVKLKRNGYIAVSDTDPRAEEIRKKYGY
jgi:hypothetical protein